MLNLAILFTILQRSPSSLAKKDVFWEEGHLSLSWEDRPWQWFFFSTSFQRRYCNNTIIAGEKHTLLFGPFDVVLWVILSFIWWVKDQPSCQTVNTISLTHPWSTPLAFPFTQMPARLCCGSETTSRGAWELQQNCPPSHLWLPHRQWCREMVRVSYTERAVWMELVLVCALCILTSVHTSGKK